jgi:spore coat protein A
MQPIAGVPGGAATYQVTVNEFDQQLHRDLPPTRVWGYNNAYPGATIEARTNQPVTVQWISDIRDENGRLRKEHYLPVDMCLHGPHMFGPTPRTTVHLHGARVAPESDGYPETTILPGESQTFVYPNNQLPATLWYHDHALGITRLNVYLGLAGCYLIRDQFEQTLGLPFGENEIPLIIQDRSFNADGTLQYPAMWMDDFFGSTMLVNGKVQPYLNVKRGQYRFRVLNACNARVLTLKLSNNQFFQQIGGDGGLLPGPIGLNEVTLMPAERADLVIDFAALAPGTNVVLTNSAPAPYPGEPGVGVVPNIMQFRVQTQIGFGNPVPAVLRPLDVIPVSQARRERDFILRQMPNVCTGMMWMINDLMWDDVVEFPQLGQVEIWRFINRSDMSHPMHMHLVHFQILDRQPFQFINNQIVPIGSPMPPAPNEAAWKDTVRVDPSMIVRVIARFDGYTGRYAYHCHMLEHEDHEMMRQFEVRTPCPGDVFPIPDGDREVDIDDLLAIITGWGPCPAPCPIDTILSGQVDVDDLLAVISNWGVCR